MDVRHGETVGIDPDLLGKQFPRDVLMDGDEPMAMTAADVDVTGPQRRALRALRDRIEALAIGVGASSMALNVFGTPHRAIANGILDASSSRSDLRPPFPGLEIAIERSFMSAQAYRETVPGPALLTWRCEPEFELDGLYMRLSFDPAERLTPNGALISVDRGIEAHRVAMQQMARDNFPLARFVTRRHAFDWINTYLPAQYVAPGSEARPSDPWEV